VNNTLPAWALRTAAPDDQALAQEAHRHGKMRITWPDTKAVRIWANQHGWSTPWFGFEEAFIAQMLQTDTNFALAITNSGIKVHFPKQQCTISGETIRELDALYENRSSNGRPTGWDALVERLRDIRRVVEAGVAVHIEGEQPLLNWQQFYAWAHGRYSMLEDGADKWIGDDS
jgi:hypothetical protein